MEVPSETRTPRLNNDLNISSLHHTCCGSNADG